MTEKFNELQNFVNELNDSNSNNDKIEVIRKYQSSVFIKRVLLYTYSPFLKFYVTPENCEKRKELRTGFNDYSDLFELLDALTDRKITGHSAIRAVNDFVSEYSQYKNLIYCILEKNLKTRIDSKSINKVIPKLIPQFEVALANKWDEKTAKKVNWDDGWFVSRKIDGIRFVTVIDSNGIITSYTRTGNVLTTVFKVQEELKKLNVVGVVFDGELCLVDENGNEDFNSVQKEWNRKDHTIENPKYKIFDIIPLEDFQNLESNIIFSDRQKELQRILSSYTGNILEPLEQVKVKSDEHLQEWINIGTQSGWEGVMLRKDTVYKGKRSDDILKVKQFHDSEYIVEDIQIGPFRVIVNNRETEEIVLSNVYINHKNNIVSVGSGFSLEQRRYFKENPHEIIGKVITVTYFEESKNQDGTLSLRFPTFKTLHGSNRLA